jgi:hypothetical protein
MGFQWMVHWWLLVHIIQSFTLAEGTLNYSMPNPTDSIQEYLTPMHDTQYITSNYITYYRTSQEQQAIEPILLPVQTSRLALRGSLTQFLIDTYPIGHNWHVPGMFDNVMEFMICAMAMWIWARGMWIYRMSTEILNNGYVVVRSG